MQELAEAQKKTESSVEELTRAQKETEQEVASLTRSVKSIRRDMGGLTDSLGYMLENSAFKSLPALLLKDFNIKIDGKIDRNYLHMESGSLQEFNITGKGIHNGKEVFILGESKSRLAVKHIKKFIKLTEHMKELNGKELFLIAVTNILHPEVEKFAIENGIKKVYKSSEF
jgi:hypothetical protein